MDLPIDPNKKNREHQVTMEKLKRESFSYQFPPMKKAEFAKHKHITLLTDKIEEEFTAIEPHHLIFLIGGAGSGKSTASMEMAIKNAEAGLKVLYFSLEMGTEAFKNKICRDKAGINYKEWGQRNVTPLLLPQIERFQREQDKLYANKNLIICSLSTPHQDSKVPATTDEIFKQILFDKPDLVFIDNFNIIESNPYEKSFDTDNRVSEEFRDFTNEHRIPVIMLHHLNKEGKLRGSAKIKDNADTVWSLVRSPYDEESEPKEKCQSELSQTKDRDFGRFVSKEIFFQRDPNLFQSPVVPCKITIGNHDRLGYVGAQIVDTSP